MYDYVVVLQILEDSKRCSGISRKCKYDKAKVLCIQNIDGSNSNVNCIKSDYDLNIVYNVGTIIRVNDFDDDRWNDSSCGIYFFMDRKEAIEYEMF